MNEEKREGTLVLIMAGGLGKRMNSLLPKVLHCIFEKPMIVHVIEQALALHPYRIGIIVGQYREKIQTTIERYISGDSRERLVYIDQPEALGTGHAIQCARDFIKSFIMNSESPDNAKRVLILSGDVPMINVRTMNGVLDKLTIACCSIITSRVENPHGYGRIITDSRGRFSRITEENDCTDKEREIRQVNAGIYAFDAQTLYDNLPYIQNNNSGNEYYLTDIIEIIRENKVGMTEIETETETETRRERNIGIYMIPQDRNYEITGINTRFQLQDLERSMNREL